MAISRRFLQPINLLNSPSDPPESLEGDFYYNTESQKIRIYDGDKWIDIGSEFFEVGETPPVNPVEGQGWFDNTEGSFYIYDGTYWQEITSVVYQGFTVSENAPSSPKEGDGWFNNVEGDFYIYDGTYWQEAVRTISAGVMSLAGTENEINVSASVGDVILSLPETINANTTGTAASLTTARTIALTGDVSGSASFDGSASVSISSTLANSGVSANSYGSASAVGTFTVDSKGRLTASSNTPIAIAQSAVTNLTTDLSAKAPLASPALTGTPTAPTAAAGTNTTQIATTAFVQSATAALVDAAPTTLDTLNELAAALGDDPNFATTVSTALGNKQPLDADLTAIAGLAGTSGFLKKTAAETWALDTNTYLTGNQTITLTGDVSGSGTTSISVTVADDSHNHIISNVDGLQTALDAKAPLASPALTGTPTAPTASAATNNTQIATTAYVKSQGYSTTTGTVTSVAMTVPTGLSVSGSPITSSGTLAVSLASGYEIPQSSSIVHIAGTETITGEKTFNSGSSSFAFVLDNTTSDSSTNKWRISPTGAAWNAGDNRLVFLYESTNSSSSLLTLDGANGRVGIGSVSPSGVLDLGTGTNGRAISWGGTAANYSNIWTAYSSGSLVLARGLRGTTATSDGYVSSYGLSSISRTAIRLDSTGPIYFYVDAASTVADGTSITPTKRMEVTTAGAQVVGNLSASTSIGITSGPLWTNDNGKFQTAASVRIDAAGALYLVSNSAAISFGGSSDVAIKRTAANTLTVNGTFTATTKSFDIEHPTKKNMRLRYGSLESPYHGINLTGESFTKKGICKVELPDYIHGLVKRDGINIQLTNIGHGKVMWIEDIDIENNNFTVKTKSKKECRFFWSLVAIRKDIDDLVVEYEKDNS